MSEWKTLPVKDLYEGLYDGPHATPKPSLTGPIFLGIKNVSEHGRLDLSKIRHIAEDDFAVWTRRVEPRENDLVFTYEATLNLYALIPKGFRGCLGRRMALIRTNPEKVDARFLLYYFFTKEWRAIIESKKLSGATVDRIPLTSFPDFPVCIPPLTVQRRLADILSAYDELIENSQRRIKILESMARNLYREWFVYFRYPGHESVPLLTSALGDIPKGWEVTTLGDLVDLRKGKNITKTTIRNGIVPVVAGGLKPAYFHDVPNTDGPVVTISASGANAGYVHLYHEDIWASDCTYIDSTATEQIFYYYLWLDRRRSSVRHLQRGSAQPHVYTKDLEELQALRVPKEILDAFNSQITPTFDLVKLLVARINNLRATQDLLLPRLLSGQIKMDAVA